MEILTTGRSDPSPSTEPLSTLARSLLVGTLVVGLIAAVVFLPVPPMHLVSAAWALLALKLLLKYFPDPAVSKDFLTRHVYLSAAIPLVVSYTTRLPLRGVSAIINEVDKHRHLTLLEQILLNIFISNLASSAAYVTAMLIFTRRWKKVPNIGASGIVAIATATGIGIFVWRKVLLEMWGTFHTVYQLLAQTSSTIKSRQDVVSNYYRRPIIIIVNDFLGSPMSLLTQSAIDGMIGVMIAQNEFTAARRPGILIIIIVTGIELLMNIPQAFQSFRLTFDGSVKWYERIGVRDIFAIPLVAIVYRMLRKLKQQEEVAVASAPLLEVTSKSESA